VSKEIKADYTKTYLFPPSVEDWVDADHPARCIRAVVGELDLDQYGFKVGRREHGMDNGAGQGRPYYSDELLLKAWLYGYEALRVLKEEDTATVHPKEREARMMKLGAEKRLGYNAQAVVDEKTGRVVAEKVVNAAADQGELDGMLDETGKNLGKTAEDTVADKGYRSDEAIGKAYEKKQSVLVHLYENEQPGKADRYHKCNFQYDEQIDVFICPEGKRLTFEREATQWRQGWKQRVYRCRQLHNCPKASECSQDARGRTVALGRYWKAVQEQRERQSQEGNRGKMWKRRTIVELVFAQIKHNSGFRRYTFPGLSGVQAQWSFLCTAHNLKKLYALWKQGNLALDPAT